MARHSVTFIAIILMLCFGIFFGIELATKGMEQIQGPIVQGQTPAGGVAYPYAGAGVQQPGGTGAGTGAPAVIGQASVPTAGTPTGGAGQTAASASVPVKPQPQPITADSGINRVGNQIGDMLQAAAHGTIRTIVSLLDSVVN
ncbi:hypothetical protein [Paenibacillus ginsengarvi]|uniref:Translation initiation factor 2 n=1 Tax=Paenibacillus ginsengarvi TaxID=400777 RepID=A0A3B0C114_9BACL|nr:hypothetical protein [Paenibacillus ginsengarvi]RKN78990.1 hypothetical protein D7M11_21705 [Paenibacillus ginsengarvi]